MGRLFMEERAVGILKGGLGTGVWVFSLSGICMI